MLCDEGRTTSWGQPDVHRGPKVWIRVAGFYPDSTSNLSLTFGKSLSSYLQLSFLTYKITKVFFQLPVLRFQVLYQKRCLFYKSPLSLSGHSYPSYRTSHDRTENLPICIRLELWNKIFPDRLEGHSQDLSKEPHEKTYLRKEIKKPDGEDNFGECLEEKNLIIQWLET